MNTYNRRQTFAAALVSANLALKSNSIVGVVSTDLASEPDFNSRITSYTIAQLNSQLYLLRENIPLINSFIQRLGQNFCKMLSLKSSTSHRFEQQ